MGLLTGSRTLFSLLDPVCRSKVCNAMASGRNMYHPAPQFAEKREKRACSCDGGGPYSGVKHHEAFGEKAMRQQENRRVLEEHV